MPITTSQPSSTAQTSGLVSAKRQQQLDKESREYKERKVKELNESYQKITQHMKEYDDMSEQFQDCVQVYKMTSDADFEAIRDIEPFEKLEEMLEDWRVELVSKSMTQH